METAVVALAPVLQTHDSHTIGHTLASHEAVTVNTDIVLNLRSLLQDLFHLVHGLGSSAEVGSGRCVHNQHYCTLVLGRHKTHREVAGKESHTGKGNDDAGGGNPTVLGADKSSENVAVLAQHGVVGSLICLAGIVVDRTHNTLAALAGCGFHEHGTECRTKNQGADTAQTY